MLCAVCCAVLCGTGSDGLSQKWKGSVQYGRLASVQARTVCQTFLSKGALDNLKELILSRNQISDAGLSALAKAITPGPSGKGALDHLTVCWLPTALSACPET